MGQVKSYVCLQPGWVGQKSLKYAYVIYDLNHRSNVDIILNYFKKKKIYHAGRCGSWQYLNSDQVIFQSKNLVNKIFQ